jgi:putative addiction module component (TIGR02574 family)
MSSTLSGVDNAFLIAQSLKPADKLELISRLWESIALANGCRPSDADLAEIKRRSAELDQGTVKSVPWDVVRDAVRSRIARHE